MDREPRITTTEDNDMTTENADGLVAERVQLTIDGPVATISLNRPNKLNALYPEMILQFLDHIETVRRDNTVRALVIRGEGRAFCAGDDLAPEDRFKYGAPDLQTRLKTGYPRIVMELLTLRKPVIGIIQGYAVGAGFDIALACDFRFSDPDAKYGATYVQRGLGGGATYLLPRFVGLGRATEMLLTGRFIEMTEATDLGLVTHVVAADSLESEAYDYAARMAKSATQAIGAIKNARNQGLGLDPVKGFEAQILSNIELMFHKDARIGPRAFREKREPNFTAEWIDLQYDDLVEYE
jgi:enoyl-CoA hydratase/carnithine racemase